MRKLFRSIASGISSVLQKPRLLVEFACVVLAGLIWFAGPYVGLESIEVRIQLIIGLSIFRFLVNIVDHYVAVGKSNQLESSLQQQAVSQVERARPDRKEELVALRTQFDKALTALKSSKLGKGHQGKAALYSLPWYMFIGPPASGKSTALRESGLQFPYMGGGGQGLPGLGGTRNCDWWFTNEAVLLDTAGRYVTQDEDQEEWLGFLDLLKKNRRAKPINGVLAVMSVADLMQAPDEEIELHAKKVRARIDELIQRLGMVFPVYLIFTKCDLVQGFVEFFEDLTKTEREQIWGCTLGVTELDDETPKAKFKSEFQKIVAGLRGRSLSRLSNARGTHKINIFGFPLQFGSIENKFAHFVEVLFQENPYQEVPMFRGFYFTSGTQEGTPIDRILGAVGRESGIPSAVTASMIPSEKKSYFLKDLFTNVIFPDQILASPSSTFHRQQGFARVAAFAAASVLVVLSLAAFGYSYIENKLLLGGTLSTAVNNPPPRLGDNLSVEQNIEFFDALGRRLDQIRFYEQEGIPMRLWGLYEGGKLYEPLRDLYLKHFTRTFLLPTKERSELQLEKFAYEGDGGAGRSEQYLAMLKAYVMMGEPNRLNQGFLGKWLTDSWITEFSPLFHGETLPRWVQQGIARLMTLYSHHLVKDTVINFPLNQRLIPLVQERLRQVPMAHQIYALTRQEWEETFPNFSMQNVLGSSDQVGLRNDYEIPGMFTYDVWEKSFQEILTRKIDEAKKEIWVLGEGSSYEAEFEEQVKALYFDDYVFYWRSFLKGLRIQPTATPSGTEKFLKNISQVNSSMIHVLKVVDYNTIPGPAKVGRLQEKASNYLQMAKEWIGLEPTTVKLPKNPALHIAMDTDFSKKVSTKFKALHQLVYEPDEAEAISPISQYVAELKKVHRAVQVMLRDEEPSPDTKKLARSIVLGEPSEIGEAVKKTKAILLQLDDDHREVLEDLLLEPIMMAGQGVMERTKSELNQKWEATVYKTCERTISNKYPFRAMGEDAGLEDVVEFLHPTDGALWKFYEKELQPFVIENVDRWEARKWNGVGLPLSEESLEDLRIAKRVSESLFNSPTTELGNTYELYPYPPRGEGSRMISEVRLEIGGTPLQYRMEPQEWHQLEWPGARPSMGATLQVQKMEFDKEEEEIKTSWQGIEQKDWWGIFRLLDEGDIEQLADNHIRVRWDLQGVAERPVQIMYELKTQGHKNPFLPGFLKSLRCVHQL